MLSDSWDGLDRALVEALALAPRAPFSRLADILATSDQTVARRYQRLRDRVGLRVIGQLTRRYTGSVDWHLRLECTPDAAAGVGHALASREDCRWVQLCSGGTEITCVIRSPTEAGPVLLERLAGGRKLVGITAHAILHQFSPTVIPALAGHLTETQRAALGKERPSAGHDDPTIAFDEVDRAIVALLGQDGRTSAADLAVATSSHESTVRRRLEHLQRTGRVLFDIDVDSSFTGRAMRAILWLSVIPTEIERVGTTLADDAHVAFVAATTGPSNLMVSVHTADAEDLYQFLTQQIGAQHEILRVETAPVMRTLKRHGHVVRS